mgnify:CR=1 FL=1
MKGIRYSSFRSPGFPDIPFLSGKPGEFVRQSDTEYTAVVMDSAAHAWVEVFIEHVLKKLPESVPFPLCSPFPLSLYILKPAIRYLDTEEDYAYLPYMTNLEHVSKNGRTVGLLLLNADAMIYREGADTLYLEVITPYEILRDALTFWAGILFDVTEITSFSSYFGCLLEIWPDLCPVSQRGAYSEICFSYRPAGPSIRSAIWIRKKIMRICRI